MDICSSEALLHAFLHYCFFFPYFGLLLEFILKGKRKKKLRKEGKLRRQMACQIRNRKPFQKQTKEYGEL